MVLFCIPCIIYFTQGVVLNFMQNMQPPIAASDSALILSKEHLEEFLVAMMIFIYFVVVPTYISLILEAVDDPVAPGFLFWALVNVFLQCCLLHILEAEGNRPAPLCKKSRLSDKRVQLSVSFRSYLFFLLW